MSTAAPPPPAVASASSLARIRAWVEERHGIFVKDYLVHQLEQRVAERMRALRLSDPELYYHVLAAPGGNREEQERLVENLTNHETSFLRNPAHFEALRRDVLPGLRQRREGRVRLASFGCSTGEEPYSLALVAAESFLPQDWERLEVVGLDLSRRVLAQAREGRYSDFTLRGLDPITRQRWFEPVTTPPAGGRVREELRRLVRFHQHNLVGPMFLSNLDVVFCCNVLIYFRPATVRRILEEIHAALAPGGFLFLGHSESALSHTDLFRPVHSSGAFYYQRPAQRSITHVPAIP